MADAWLTPQQVADRWLCRASTVRKMIDNGELPAFRIGQKLLRLKLSDVEAYECRNTNCSASEEAGPSASTWEASGQAVARLEQLMPRKRRQSLAASLQN